MTATFSQTAFAELPPYPVNYTGDFLQVTQTFSGITNQLSAWTLRVANALNKLLPGGMLSPAGGIITADPDGGLKVATEWSITGATQILLDNGNTTPAPAAPTGTQIQLVQADGVPSDMLIDSFAAVSNYFGRRAEGTNASPTAVGTGSVITGIGALGYGATGYGASVQCRVLLCAAETWTDTKHGTFARTEVTPIGSTTIGTVFQANAAVDGGCRITGTMAGDNAAGGIIGEYLSAVTLIASEVSINAAANVATLALTPGDWNVWGELWVDTLTGTATVSGRTEGTITPTSGTLVTVPADGVSVNKISNAALVASSASFILPIAPCRASLSANTNYFLVGACTVSAGTANGYGKICARRVR